MEYGRVSFYREHGKWQMLIEAPRWIVRDFADELMGKGSDGSGCELKMANRPITTAGGPDEPASLLIFINDKNSDCIGQDATENKPTKPDSE